MNNLIQELWNEWSALQPLKAVDQKRLAEKFRLEFNYNSNHLEGNTLTYGQTKLLLYFDQTDGVHELREFEEMKAHDVALKKTLEEALDKQKPLTESFIRSLNELILVRPFWKEAETYDGSSTRIQINVGEYKTRPNHVRTVTGEIFHYASEQATPSLMSELVAWFNQEFDNNRFSPIEIASLLHYRYIRIHPFEDGNGRIARLLVNYVLTRAGYPLLIVPTKDKDNYLRLLRMCDVEVGLDPIQGANAELDQIQPFVLYFERLIIKSLHTAIKAGKGESIEDEDDFEKRLALLNRELIHSDSIKPSYKKEHYVLIMQNVYYQLANKLNECLKGTSQFFRSSEMNGGSLIRGASLPMKINPLNKISSNYQSDHVLEIDYVYFEYHLHSPINIKLNKVSIDYRFEIRFNPDFYEVILIGFMEPLKFNYNTFPSLEELDDMISICKQHFLQTVKTAIEL
jgi:Fic family protein